MVRSFNTARVICVEMFYPLDFQAMFFIPAKFSYPLENVPGRYPNKCPAP